MPLKHRRCFCSGQRSQQHHPLPSKGWGQRGWGLPPRVCSIPLCPQNTGNCTQIVCSWKKKNNKNLCSASSSVILSQWH